MDGLPLIYYLRCVLCYKQLDFHDITRCLNGSLAMSDASNQVDSGSIGSPEHQSRVCPPKSTAMRARTEAGVRQAQVYPRGCHSLSLVR
jgi:hypothetical protein